MARKGKAQEKEAEGAANADKKPEERPKEQGEEQEENEPTEEVNPEPSTVEKTAEEKEPAKPAEEKPKATAESTAAPAQTTPAPQVSQSSTIEKPPSSSVIASHLPNTLIDSTLKFFVGGLHPNTDEAELSNYFAKYGQILSTQVMRDLATGRHRGFGFVTLKVQPNSMSVFKDTHTVTGKRIDVRAMQSDVAASLRKKIFVGGLSKALNEEMLEEYFSKFGEVDKVTIMRQLDGSSRGFGFIVFTTDEAASGALRNPTHFVYGNKVDVRAAESRPKNSSQSNQSNHSNQSAQSYPYAMMQAPADMYSAASQMYRHQGAYDPSQYASMTQMSQQQYPQYQQYQLLQQQMVQQQMAMAGTYGAYYNAAGQAATPASGTPAAANPYAAPSGGSSRPNRNAAYGAYRGKNDQAYPGVNQGEPSNSRGYRQQPY